MVATWFSGEQYKRRPGIRLSYGIIKFCTKLPPYRVKSFEPFDCKQREKFYFYQRRT